MLLNRNKYIFRKPYIFMKIKKAIEEYKNNKINISGGAEMAGLAYREFLEKL